MSVRPPPPHYQVAIQHRPQLGHQWSMWEDYFLLKTVGELGLQNWHNVSQKFQGIISPETCQVHYHFLVNKLQNNSTDQPLTKWNEEDDPKLKEAYDIFQNEDDCWQVIRNLYFNSFSANFLLNRFVSIKRWTKEENRLLALGVKNHPDNWDVISQAYFGGAKIPIECKLQYQNRQAEIQNIISEITRITAPFLNLQRNSSDLQNAGATTALQEPLESAKSQDQFQEPVDNRSLRRISTTVTSVASRVPLPISVQSDSFDLLAQFQANQLETSSAPIATQEQVHNKLLIKKISGTATPVQSRVPTPNFFRTDPFVFSPDPSNPDNTTDFFELDPMASEIDQADRADLNEAAVIDSDQAEKTDLTEATFDSNQADRTDLPEASFIDPQFPYNDQEHPSDDDHLTNTTSTDDVSPNSIETPLPGSTIDTASSSKPALKKDHWKPDEETALIEAYVTFRHKNRKWERIVTHLGAKRSIQACQKKFHKLLNDHPELKESVHRKKSFPYTLKRHHLTISHSPTNPQNTDLKAILTKPSSPLQPQAVSSPVISVTSSPIASPLPSPRNDQTQLPSVLSNSSSPKSPSSLPIPELETIYKKLKALNELEAPPAWVSKQTSDVNSPIEMAHAASPKEPSVPASTSEQPQVISKPAIFLSILPPKESPAVESSAQPPEDSTAVASSSTTPSTKISVSSLLNPPPSTINLANVVVRTSTVLDELSTLFEAMDRLPSKESAISVMAPNSAESKDQAEERVTSPTITPISQTPAQIPWTEDENNQLLVLVGYHGLNWNYVSHYLDTNRTQTECKNQFEILSQKPSAKRAVTKKVPFDEAREVVPEKRKVLTWTPAEEAELESLVRMYGKAWTVIAPLFSTKRTVNAISQHYNIMLERQKTEIDKSVIFIESNKEK